jgi:hypothetical protein
MATVTGVPAGVGAPTLAAPQVPPASTVQVAESWLTCAGTTSVSCAPLAATVPTLRTRRRQTIASPGPASAGPTLVSARSAPGVYGRTVS